MPERRFSLPLLSIAALTLSACAPLPPSSLTPQAPELSAQQQQERFPAAYSQSVHWESCTDKGLIDEESLATFQESDFDLATFECAQVDAPLDWNASDEKQAGHITLEISRIRPSDADAERPAIFVNPGGPGESGLLVWADAAAAGDTSRLAQDYDLIAFDPRGIGNSTPLDCEPPTDDADFGQYLTDCAQRNPVAAHMGTSSVARDMELIRHLLDQEHLHYLGYSYGTMLGATYATLFPEHAGRMVLDSAEDSQWATPTHAWQQQVAIANALVELTNACLNDYQPQGWLQRCPFANAEEAAATIQRMNDNPLPSTGEDTLDGETLRAYMTQGLYEPEPYRATMMSIITDALDGHPDAVDLILAGEYLPPSLTDGNDDETHTPQTPGVDSTTPNTNPDTDTGHSPEADATQEENPAGQLMVTCHSFPASPDLSEVEKDINDTPHNALLDTSQSSDAVSVALDTSCTQLPFVGTDPVTRFNAEKTATPILVIGVRGDHATPYQYAENLVKELGNAQLLTVNGPGHGIAYSQRSECVDAAVDAYFLHGTMPTQTTCTLNPLPTE